IGIEVEIDEIPQESAALRDAETMGTPESRFAVRKANRIALARVVTEEGDQVTDCGEADSLNHGSLAFADQFVEVAGPKTAGQLEPNLAEPGRNAIFDFRNRFAFQGPLPARNFHTWIALAHSPGQLPLDLAFLARRIATVAFTAGQRQGIRRFIGAHFK